MDKIAVYYAWIDRRRRVVSFQKAEGFERIPFATHEEMFSFVIAKSISGYRVQ